MYKNRKKTFVMVAAPPAPRNRKISLVVKGDEPSHMDELLAALIGVGLIVITLVELLWLPLLAE